MRRALRAALLVSRAAHRSCPQQGGLQPLAAVALCSSHASAASQRHSGDRGGPRSGHAWSSAAKLALAAGAVIAAAGAPAALADAAATEPPGARERLRAEFLEWLEQQGGRMEGVEVADSKVRSDAARHRLRALVRAQPQHSAGPRSRPGNPAAALAHWQRGASAA